MTISILENTTQHGVIEGKTQAKNDAFYNLDVSILTFHDTFIFWKVFFYSIGFYKIILEKKLIRMHVPQICFLFHGG